jgi:hypothetical protein
MYRFKSPIYQLQALCNIVIEVRIPNKHVRLIKMGMREMYSRVPVGIQLNQKRWLSKLHFHFSMGLAYGTGE